jgi:CHASE2 domain-containing sensor protein
MKSRIFGKISREIASWQVGAIPGITVVGLVILARATGLLQSLEWGAFDYFLRLRPTEAVDERVTIVGMN